VPPGQHLRRLAHRDLVEADFQLLEGLAGRQEVGQDPGQGFGIPERMSV
jgi:hypothetical protein